jgi:hypothetical protein
MNVFTEKLRRQTARRIGTLSASFEVEGNPVRLTGRKKDKKEKRRRIRTETKLITEDTTKKNKLKDRQEGTEI